MKAYTHAQECTTSSNIGKEKAKAVTKQGIAHRSQQSKLK